MAGVQQVFETPPQPARFVYTSDRHPRETLEMINILRRQRELCDVVIVVNEQKIYAHRIILSACSPYFRAMFTGELAESRQTEVTIRDIDESAMEQLVDFAYSSTVTVEENNVQTLLPAACLLQLSEIQEACCEFLKRQLDPSNCLGIRAFADTHACRDLLRVSDKFTQHNFLQVGISGGVYMHNCIFQVKATILLTALLFCPNLCMVKGIVARRVTDKCSFMKKGKKLNHYCCWKIVFKTHTDVLCGIANRA